MADADKRNAGESTPSADRRPGDAPADLNGYDPQDEDFEFGDVSGQDAVPAELTTDEPIPPEDADAEPDREPTNAELEALTSEDVMAAEAAEAARAERARDGEDDGELVGVGARTERSGRTAKTGGVSKVDKKGKATPRQRPGRTEKRTSPVTFVKESVGELRKVVYPTGPQLVNYFVVVLIFVLFIIAFVGVLDLVFGWAVLRVFS